MVQLRTTTPAVIAPLRQASASIAGAAALHSASLFESAVTSLATRDAALVACAAVALAIVEAFAECCAAQHLSKAARARRRAVATVVAVACCALRPPGPLRLVAAAAVGLRCASAACRRSA